MPDYPIEQRFRKLTASNSKSEFPTRKFEKKNILTFFFPNKEIIVWDIVVSIYLNFTVT